MTSAQSHYQKGHLGAAVAAAAEELRLDPANTGKRAFYAELLCLQGAYEKADQQLATLLTLDPAAALTVSTWRHLVHAAQARHDVFNAGRAPELIGPATSRVEKRLEILLALREEDLRRAAQLAQELEATRPTLAATVNGQAYEDVRDADDVCADVLEALASNGKYFWIELAQIRELSLQPPQRPLDLLWRRATLFLSNGSEGEVFLPCTYPTATDDEAALVGRTTDWLNQEGLVRGVGQKLWLVGEDALPLGELHEFTPCRETETAAAAE
mgnify:CR=1 FL=1